MSFEKDINALVAMSNKYGADEEFVLAGGGNTSYKTADTLYIKGSGTSLATITVDGFVKIDRAELEKIWSAKFSDVEAEREAQVLSMMMNSRKKGEEGKRPSVETLLHDLLPQKFVLHVHPALVNGITCSVDGERIAAELFPDAVWVPSTKPGYILAALCREKLGEYEKSQGKIPQIIFLENHGIFISADTTEEIDVIAKEVFDAIKKKVVIFPCKEKVDFDEALAETLAPEIRMLYSAEGKAVVKHTAYHDIIAFARDREAFSPLADSFSPDHIVYCKAHPLYVENKGDETPAELEEAFRGYTEKNGFKPKIIFVQGVGMFACGGTKKEAETASIV